MFTTTFRLFQISFSFLSVYLFIFIIIIIIVFIIITVIIIIIIIIIIIQTWNVKCIFDSLDHCFHAAITVRHQ